MKGLDSAVKKRFKIVLWCEVADDSVVVIKFRPMKAGNSVEDKTEMTYSLSVRILQLKRL